MHQSLLDWIQGRFRKTKFGSAIRRKTSYELQLQAERVQSAEVTFTDGPEDFRGKIHFAKSSRNGVGRKSALGYPLDSIEL